jgi:hypothetical protein
MIFEPVDYFSSSSYFGVASFATAFLAAFSAAFLALIASN